MDIARPDHKARLRRRRFVYVGVFIAILATAGAVLGAFGSDSPSVQRSSLWIGKVQKGEMLREVRGTGTLVPRDVRWISAETDARVESILLRPGAEVTASTIILRLASPETIDLSLASRAEYAAARAEYAALQMTLQSQLLDQRARISDLESQHVIAKMQGEAEASLVRSQIIPAIKAKLSEVATEQLAIGISIERERGKNLQRSVDAQLSAAQARLDQKRTTAELRARQAEGLEVRAGIDGVLQEVPIQAGQQVLRGTSLAKVAEPDSLMVELRIPESQAGEVEIGQLARIDIKGDEVTGKVSRIDPAVRDGTVVVEIIPDGELPAGARPDESLDGSIELERIPDVLHVGRPASAVAPGAARLFRIDGNGSATRVPVTIGRISSRSIEVVDGLAEGDEVVLSSTSRWDDYDSLQLD